ncbi:MAG: SCP2 domain-containing protein, partial [Burkholderiales bacterium]
PLDFINHVLAQSPPARARLAAHAGSVLQVDAAPFAFKLRIAADGSVARESDAAAADLVVRIAPSALPLFLTDANAARKSVRIEGDAGLAASMDAVLREARWDIEEDMSRVIGDVAAHRVGQAARALASWATQTAKDLGTSTASFLTDEEPLLARRDEAERLRDDIARTRDDVERLEKRIAALRVAEKP